MSLLITFDQEEEDGNTEMYKCVSAYIYAYGVFVGVCLSARRCVHVCVCTHVCVHVSVLESSLPFLTTNKQIKN